MSNSFTETSFLKKLFPLLNTNEDVLVPAGDDCAVIEAGGRKLALSVDQLIEGKHYLPVSGPYKAGRKLMARNLSDLAAMGAKPLFALICLAAGPDKGEEWLISFHKGILSEADLYDVTVIGGDLAVAPTDTLASLTIIGEIAEQPLLRSTASEGQSIYVTGEFGCSFPSEHHLDFQPRVKEGLWLADYAKAMIDITDGLMIDSLRVAEASDLGIVFDLEKIPGRNGASTKEALTDGEDYELMFAVDAEDEKKLESDWPFPIPLTKIGRFCATVSTGQAVDVNGEDLLNKFGSGFDHFK
jgi:thiamine-monophosphate kinase